MIVYLILNVMVVDNFVTTRVVVEEGAGVEEGADNRQIRRLRQDVLCGLDLVAATIIKDFVPDVRMVLGVEQNIIVIRRMKVVAEDVVLLQAAEAVAEVSRLIPLIA